MITINLIPEKQREFLAKERMFRNALKQVSLFTIVPIIFVGMLGMLLFIRNIELQELENVDIHNQQVNIYQELLEYESDFRETNKRVALISGVMKEGLFWSKIFETLEKLSVDGISLTKFSSNDYSVNMEGTADTRQKLLNFQDKLADNECFVDINSPLSNLVNKNNIEFVLDINISQDCLRSVK